MPIDDIIQDSLNTAVGATQGATMPSIETPPIDPKIDIVSDHNKTITDYNLGLPIVNDYNEITPENARKVDNAKVIAHLTKANRELRIAKQVLGGKELESFTPFKSIEDIRARADEYANIINKASEVKTSKEQSDLLSKVNNYISTVNKEGGIDVPLFKNYKEAKSAVTLGKDGKFPLQIQFDALLSDKKPSDGDKIREGLLNPVLSDIPEARLNIAIATKAEREIKQVEDAKKRKEAIARLSNLRQKNGSENYLTALDTQYLDKSSVHNTREEADAKVLEIASKNPYIKGVGVREMQDGTFEVFVPEQEYSNQWHKDASQITAESALDKRNKANALMPQYKVLKDEIKRLTMEGMPIPTQTLAQYNEVSDEIQNYLEASDILSDVSESNYLKYSNLERKRGGTLNSIVLEGMEGVNSITKGLVNLALTTPQLAMLPLPSNSYENTDFFKSLENAKENVDEFFSLGTKGLQDAMGVSPTHEGGIMTESAKNVAGILPYMLSGSSALPFMIATGFDANRESLKDNKELTTNEKNLISLVKGTISGVAMSEGLKIVGGHTALNKVAYNVLDKLPTKFTQKTLSNLVGKELTEYVANMGAGGVGFGALNVATNVAGQATDEVVKLATNKRFDPQSTHDALGDLVGEFNHGLATGALLGAVTGIAKLGSDRIKNVKEFRAIDELVQDPSSLSLLKLKLGKQVIDKQITKAEYKLGLENLQNISNIATQIPKEYSTNARYEIFKLLQDNAKLEKAKEGLAPAFIGRYDKMIAENNKAIEEIADKEDAKLKSNDTQDTKVTDTEGTTTNRQTDLPKAETSSNGDVVATETKAVVGSEEVTPPISESGSPATETATKEETPPALSDVESTSKALEIESKNKSTIWEQVKNAAKNIIEGIKNIGKSEYEKRRKLVDDIEFNDYPSDKEGEIILKKDGKNIGSMDLHYGADGLLHIKWVKINKDFQGKGLSLLLYGKATEIAAQKGLKGVGTGFVTHSTTKTQGVYKHFNLTELGESKGSMEEGVKGRKVILHSLKDGNENNSISEAYHKAKSDGSNPELVKAVESLLSKEQSTSTTQTDIEAKKADIERRRQEELDKYSHAITVKSVTYKFVDDFEGGDDTTLEVKVDTKADGSVHVITYFEGEVANREIVTNKDRIADVKGLIGAKGSVSVRQEDGTYSKFEIKESTITEEIENTVSENKKVKEINAKYDAELKALEQSTSTTQSESNPALSDVEATAKALERVGNKNLERSETDETPTAKDVDYGDITWQQYGISSFNKGSDGKTYITDKNGDIYEISKTKVSANNTFLVVIKNKKGDDIGNFEFKKNKDGSFSAEEAFVSERRKGLASIAYDFASKDGIIIKPSNRLKSDGINFWSKSISEAYHKAKADGSNPELVKAVESLLSKEQTPTKDEITTLADKIRSLKTPKGSLKTDITLGLKDMALEEIAQLVEDGMEVAKAIAEAFKDAKYKALDRKEISDLIFSKFPITEDDFKRRDSEKAIDRTNRVMADLKARGYAQNEIDYIMKGGFERIARVDDLREVKAVVDNLNKIFDEVKKKAKGYISDKGATDKAVERVQHEWVFKGKEIILENAIRKFKKEHGIEVKTPADNKVKPKPTMITVDEKKALIDQIKTLNRGAKIITDGFKEISAKINDIIKEYKTTISTRQLNAIQKRMAYLKVGSNESIRKFVDYVEKVLADAEYADQLAEVKSTAKKIKKLIKNDKIPATVRATANDFISLDASDVRNLNKHQIIMNELYDAMKSGGIKVQQGEIVDKTRKAVDLDRINEYIADETELAYKRMQESMAEEYNETTENLESEDPIDATDMIKEYVKNKFATLSRMVQSMIINGTSPLDGEGYDFSKEELSMIKKATAIKLDNFDNVKDWYEATEALDHLLTNGDMGLIPHILNKYDNAVIVNKGVETLKSKLAGKISELPITRAFAGLEALFKLRAKDSHAEKVFFDNSSFRRWDNLLKNFKDYGIYENTFYHLAKGQSNYKTVARAMDADRIQKQLFKDNGYDQKKTLESKFKITAFLRQLEFESNPESKTNKPAIDYLNATIEAAENLNHPIQGKALDMLKDVIAENSTDGQIDLSKLQKNMTPAEKKAVTELQKLYKDLAPYHTKVSLAIRNKPFTAIDNYSHISAYSKDNKILSPSETKRQYMNVLQGTKSGTIEERTGVASAINLDPFASANKAVRDVLLDYYMTNPFRNVEKILTKFKDYAVEEKRNVSRGTPEYDNAVKRENIADAWLGVFNDARENMLMRSYYESSPLKELAQLIQKRAVQFALGKPDRLLAELASNASFVMSSATKEFALGSTKYLKYNGGEIQAKIMENVQSSATERLHPHGGIATSVMDTQDFDIAVADDQNISSPVRRKALQFYYNTLAKGIGTGQMINEGMITSGDLLIARPIWTGTMASEFKKLTGKEIDFDKIAENDIEYMDANEVALDKARTVADRKVTDAAASKNPFETAPKMSNRSTQIWQAINTYMRGFNMNEYELASDAVMHLYEGGKMSRADATRILGGITARAGMYKAVNTMAETAIMGGIMAGWAAMKDDDKEYTEAEKELGLDKPDTPENRRAIAQKMLEKYGQTNPITGEALKTTDEEAIKFWKSQAEEPNSFSEDFVKGIAQQYMSLLTQRNFGNIVQGYVTAPIFEEMINKKIREQMGMEYNPYKDGLLYSKLPDTDKKNWLINAVEQGTGAYGTPLAMFMETAMAGVNLRKDMAALDEVDKKIDAHKKGTPTQDASLKDYYKLVEQQKAIRTRIMDNWVKVGKETSIALGMVSGAIPGLKNIDKAMDKKLQDKFRKPKDWNELMKRMKAIKEFGVDPADIPISEDKKHKPQVSEMFPDGKIPETYEDAIKKITE